jgi:predicted nucleic acid-binding protein
MTDAAVTNSTCLIGLERIQRLDILPQVFLPIIIPAAVQAEVGITASWLTVVVVQNQVVAATLKTQVDDGEAEAIALALESSHVFVILDDLNARRLATQLGLKVIGTVGMLLRAKQQGIISEIKPLLTDLNQADFRISEAIVQRALQLAGE